MADRNQRSRRERSYRDHDYFGSRQAEQLDDTSYDQDFDPGERERFQGGQMGESRGAQPGAAVYYEETMIVPRRGRAPRGGQGYGDYDRSQFADRDVYGAGDYFERGGYEQGRRSRGSRYDNRYDRGFQPFTSEDQGGRDFVRGGRRPYDGYGRGFGGGYYDESRAADEYHPTRGPGYGYRGDYGDHDRGFFQRAGDEVASWFGDEEAARRREMDHRGSGPSNYTRSDERILEDACDSLTDDWRVDARNIQVTVKDGEVTLDGTVDDRDAKRCAEDCVEDISGVRHVQNNLRVQDRVGDNSDYSARESEAANN